MKTTLILLGVLVLWIAIGFVAWLLITPPGPPTPRVRRRQIDRLLDRYHRKRR